MLNTDTKPNIDHIVPLALGGTNDPTNFQWICFECNNRKLGHTVITTNKFNTYWDIND
ncbi:HNH endonuclease [Acinetobacter indicus]|nr:HNH endonuclease [Acinetobacter indicus]